MDTTIKALQNTLDKFIKYYQKNPIKYFYEEDIRAELLVSLVNDKIFDIHLPITDNNKWLRDYKNIFNDEIRISGIKAEYPSNTRFDIAYINPNIKSNNCFNQYILECLFAIEVKLSQNDNKNADFKSDIEKLRDYQKLHPNFTGLAINFEQNPNYKKEDIFKDYNNYNNIKMIDVIESLDIVENSINYFFISKDFIVGSKSNAT